MGMFLNVSPAREIGYPKNTEDRLRGKHGRKPGKGKKPSSAFFNRVFSLSRS